MIALFLMVAFAEEIQVDLTLGGTQVSFTAVQLETGQFHGGGSITKPQIMPMTLSLPGSQTAPEAFAASAASSPANQSGTLDVLEADPTQPGQTRLQTRYELEYLVIDKLDLVVDSQAGLLDQLRIQAAKIRECRYTWPGPTTTCSQWNYILNQEAW